MILLAFLQSVALVGGTVHTMVPGETPKVMTIVIDGERIQAIGPDARVPDGARKVDVTGMHLVPGLIDAMVNHDSDHDRLYVSSGVTLVRDVGNDLVRSLAERDPDARDRGPGPALWCSGAVLDGMPPATTSAVVLTSPEDAEGKLPRLFDLDLNFLSLYQGLSVPTWHKVIELAKKRNLQVWGPVMRGATLRDVVASGQDGLYYLEGFLPPNVTWDKIEPDEWTASVELVAGSKLAITPVLGLIAQRLVPRTDSAPQLAYLGPFYIVSWMADLELRRSIVNKDFLQSGARVVATQGRLLKDLFDHGVTLVPGSASPNPWLFPGDALIDELALWARAGIPSDAILRMATAGAAHAIGADRDRGTLKAGLVADIDVLKGDPSVDVGNLRNLEAVVLRGRVHDRGELERMRAELRARQQQLQQAAFKPLSIQEPELPFGDVLLRGVVETRTFGQRVSGESYGVVRRPDKSVVYCGHLFTPGSATTADTDVQVTQTMVGEELTGFSVHIASGQRTIDINGTLVGGSMNIERHIDGGFVDNVPRKERFALIDVGSVTTALILGQRRTIGTFRALYLEDIDPAMADFEMHVDKDGTHLLKTPTGMMKITFEAVGAPREWSREQGRGVLTTRSLSTQKGDGPGLPIPADKPLGK
jgi:hypothetical protein